MFLLLSSHLLSAQNDSPKNPLLFPNNYKVSLEVGHLYELRNHGEYLKNLGIDYSYFFFPSSSAKHGGIYRLNLGVPKVFKTGIAFSSIKNNSRSTSMFLWTNQLAFKEHFEVQFIHMRQKSYLNRRQISPYNHEDRLTTYLSSPTYCRQITNSLILSKYFKGPFCYYKPGVSIGTVHYRSSELFYKDIAISSIGQTEADVNEYRVSLAPIFNVQLGLNGEICSSFTTQSSFARLDLFLRASANFNLLPNGYKETIYLHNGTTQEKKTKHSDHPYDLSLTIGTRINLLKGK